MLLLVEKQSVWVITITIKCCSINSVMKAVNNALEGNYLKVDAFTTDGQTSVSMSGNQITPRGVCGLCSEDVIAALHASGDVESQPKFQTLLLNLELGFNDGEIVQLETEAQIQSIRRVSQSEFEVYMAFNNMMQDGYRHIARYIVDSEVKETQ